MARHFVLDGCLQANILGEFLFPIVNLILKIGDLALQVFIGRLNSRQFDVKPGVLRLKIVHIDFKTVLLRPVDVKLVLKDQLVVLDRVQLTFDKFQLILIVSDHTIDRIDLSLNDVHLHLDVSIKALE